MFTRSKHTTVLLMTLS